MQIGIGLPNPVPGTPGTRLLDVACGTGNCLIPAARAGAVVTGVDIATNLVEQARARAAKEGLRVDVREGDVLAHAGHDLEYAPPARMSSFGSAPSVRLLKAPA